MAPRSFADDIRGRDDAALHRLLSSRRDLASPPPADLTALAARAATAASVRLALGPLTEPQLHALESVVVLGSVDAERLAGALGVEVADAAPLLDDLTRRALLWKSPQGHRAVRAAAEVLPEPAGLAPAAAEPLPRREIDRLLPRVGDAGRQVLDALAWGPATGVLPPADSAAGRATVDLLGLGLLQRLDERHVRLPREVALVLREGRTHRGVRPRPPLIRPGDAPDSEPPTASTSPPPGGPGADAVAADGALATVVAATEVLDVLDTNPPKVLRTGGLGVRDLAALAGAVGLSTVEAEELLEALVAAELLAADPPRHDTRDTPGSWRPTTAADGWRRSPVPERWASLVGAWLTTSASVALTRARAGGGSGRAERVTVLDPATSGSDHRAARQELLRALADLPAGSAPGAEALTDLLAWRHPRRSGRRTQGTDSGTRTSALLLARAEQLGLIGRGVMSEAGRALVHGEHDTAVAALARHVPAPVDHLLIQGDLTAIAPGPLTADAEHDIRLLADTESRGTAAVYRIGEQSLRRALDLGWSADRVLATLAGLSRTGVPQPLEYLVRDTARRHGAIRVGSGATVLRSDDPALLDAVEADRELGLLQVRRLAATVLVSPVPSPTVLDLLRERGYAPLAEGRDGAVQVAGERRRARVAPRPPVRIRPLGADDLRELIERLRGAEGRRERSDDLGAAAGAQVPHGDAAETLALLRDALALGEAVWIGHADADGDVRRVLLRPVRIEGGRVLGLVGEPGTSTQVPLHRITGAVPAR